MILKIKTETQECQNLSSVQSTNNSLNIPHPTHEDQASAQQISVNRRNSKTLILELKSEDEIRTMETDNIVYLNNDGCKELNVSASTVVTSQPDIVQAVQYDETDTVQAVQYDESDIVQAVQYVETDTVEVLQYEKTDPVQAVKYDETNTVQVIQYNETDSVQAVQYDETNTISSERIVYSSDTKRLEKWETKNFAHCAQSENLAHCAQSENLACSSAAKNLTHSASTDNLAHSATTENLTHCDQSEILDHSAHCAQSENLAHCESEIEEEETHYVEILSVASLGN